MTCPKCDGQALVPRVLRRGDEGIRMLNAPCSRCGGTGEVSELTVTGLVCLDAGDGEPRYDPMEIMEGEVD